MPIKYELDLTCKTRDLYGAVHKFYNTLGGREVLQSPFSSLLQNDRGEGRGVTNFVMIFTYFSLNKQKKLSNYKFRIIFFYSALIEVSKYWVLFLGMKQRVSEQQNVYNCFFTSLIKKIFFLHSLAENLYSLDCFQLSYFCGLMIMILFVIFSFN